MSDEDRLRTIAKLQQRLGALEYEKALRESEQKFRLLVEAVQDYAIFMLDAHGRVNSWNVGAERLKGYKATEIMGAHFSKFYPPKISRLASPNANSKLPSGMEESRTKAGAFARMVRDSGPTSSSPH